MLAIWLIAIATIGAVESAFACSCVDMTPQESLAEASAVFSGTVIDVRSVGIFQNVVTFDVGETWKGVSRDGMQVNANGSGDTCGIEFEIGREYLVYAYNDHQGGLETSICARTRSLQFAEADLAALGPGDSTLALESAEVFREISVAFPFLYLIGIGAAIAGVIAFLSLRNRK